jgi:hypothetical protein
MFFTSFDIFHVNFRSTAGIFDVKDVKNMQTLWEIAEALAITACLGKRQRILQRQMRVSSLIQENETNVLTQAGMVPSKAHSTHSSGLGAELAPLKRINCYYQSDIQELGT